MVAVKLAQQLKCEGNRISFLAAKGSFSENVLKDTSITLLSKSTQGYIDLRGMKEIHQWIRNEHVDIVHAHYSKDPSDNPPIGTLLALKDIF